MILVILSGAQMNVKNDRVSRLKSKIRHSLQLLYCFSRSKPQSTAAMKISPFLLLVPALLFSCESSDEIENRSGNQETVTTETPPVLDEIDGRDTIKTKTQSEFSKMFTAFQTAVY